MHLRLTLNTVESNHWVNDSSQHSLRCHWIQHVCVSQGVSVCTAPCMSTHSVIGVGRKGGPCIIRGQANVLLGKSSRKGFEMTHACLVMTHHFSFQLKNIQNVTGFAKGCFAGEGWGWGDWTRALAKQSCEDMNTVTCSCMHTIC